MSDEIDWKAMGLPVPTVAYDRTLEAELVRVRQELSEFRCRAFEAEGKVLRLTGTGRGQQRTGEALFRKRPRGKFDESLCEATIDPDSDRIFFKWTRAARWSLIPGMVGEGMYLDGTKYHYLPQEIRAEGWWHLCAELGLVEGIVRAIYIHPEDGQPSAVAAAPAARERGPQVFCQSQHDPDEW